MPRFATYPPLLDGCKTLNIAFLIQQGYLIQNHSVSGVVKWCRNGNEIGKIGIRVNMTLNDAYIELNYKYNDVSIGYKVELVSIPSNIGKGFIWYFVCPRTGKRCRKLYLVDTYFYHHTAFRGCYYEKQIQSKKYREFEKTLGLYYQCDQLYSQLYKKHLKKQYAGKPTKKYLKITRQIEKAESIPIYEIERALIG
jgi:hypothetical protein